MDNWKTEGTKLSYDRERQDGSSGGGVEEEEEEEDLFGDDDIFSKISEDSMWIEETQGQSEPQPSTSYQSLRPPLPNSTPLERLPLFDQEAGSTWIYPVNYPLRDYQYSMVETSLFRNTLISLPTGLGKTFIAAVVMYNFYRWYPTCKVVFMAPTKPLVFQQIEACFNIMGIPQEHISQMTGTLNPEKRTEQWGTKRVFFLTPQVVTNDLSRGSCPAKLIKCLVLDEAHRALGNHAYCQVVRELKEHGHDFRILALSATPGSDVMAVKQVLSNLCISHVELRSEDSPDIQEYTFQRSVEKVVVPFGEELTTLKNKYLKVLRVYVRRLLDLNVLHTRDETTLTKFQLLKSRECFRQNMPSSMPRKQIGVVEGLFAMCMTLYHSYELMLQHGTRSFYRFLKESLNGEKSNYFLRLELHNNELFQSIMNELSKKFEGDGEMSPSKQNQSGLFSMIGSSQPINGATTSPQVPFVISHPKMAKLLEIVLEHHQKFANEGKSTRIMIFSQYRESVVEITEMLQQHHPTVKAMSFVGHSTKSQSGKGFSQKKQLEVVSKFRGGDYNTLVSTCVGEEGLDIGDVDLIICYDAPKSPIRLVQRMGRTGRRREGRIVMLVTEGKEEQSYNASQYQKKAINNALANTSRLARYLSPSSPRMVPLGVSPSCLKLHMKVDAWKTNTTKDGRATPKGRASIRSMISRTTTSSATKAAQATPLMSQKEWQWCKDNSVPQQDIKTLPPPSLMCLKGSQYTVDREKHINLGSYQPWQTLLQKTHQVGHSRLTRNLVEVTEFIGLQQLIGPHEDPYGLEMVAFLDKAYVEDDKEMFQLNPDCERQNEEDQIENKRKRKQNAVTSKRKKQKVVQSSLITDMFSRMAQSQLKNRDDDWPKEKVQFEEATEGPVAGPSQCSVKSNAVTASAVHVRDNGGGGGDDDDDVVCLMDYNDCKSQPTSEALSQNDRHKSAVKMESSKTNTLDKNCATIVQDEKPNGIKGQLFLPIPSGSVPSISLLMPPPDNDEDDDDGEIEEPGSPSELLEFCSKWVTRNQKKVSAVRQKHNASSCFQDVFESFITQRLPGGNVASTLIDGDGDDEQQQDSSLFSVGGSSPVIGKSQCIIKKGMTDTSDSGNQSLVSPRCGADLMELDTSPIVGRGTTQLSASTPKVVSKRLFKKFTPGVSCVEEFSPIPWKAGGAASPGGVGHSAGRGSKGQQDTPRQAAPPQNHTNRFKSKLSKFAKSEVSELESIAETSSAQKTKVGNEMSVVEESGKSLAKKLCYDARHGEEKTSFESNKNEVQKSNLNQNFEEIRDVERVQNDSKNNSSFVFEDLNIPNLSRNNENQIPEEKNEEEVMFIGCNNVLNPGDLPQSSQKPKKENMIKDETNTTNTVHGGRSQQGVVQDAKVKSTKDTNKSNEASVSHSPDMMEDCSLFEHIAECGVESAAAKSPAEDLNNSSYGLSVTQVLNFMNEKSDCSGQHASTSNIFPKPSPIHSRKLQGSNRQSVGHSASNLSLCRDSPYKMEAESDKGEVPSTSTTTQTRDGPRLPLSRTCPKLPGKGNHATEQKTQQQQHVKEKHISFSTHDIDDFEEMSESLLADVDLELAEAHHSSTNDVGSSRNSSGILCPMPYSKEKQVDRTLEGSKDLFTTRHSSNGSQDDTRERSKLMSPPQTERKEGSRFMSPLQTDTREGSKFMTPTQIKRRESSKLMSPPQTDRKENSKLTSPTQADLRESSRFMSPTQDETQLVIKRKRKVYHIVGSDQEDSLTSDSEKDVSKVSITSGSSKTSSSTISTGVAASVRKGVAGQMRSHFDDEDDDFVGCPGPPRPKLQEVKNVERKKKKKKKRKRLGYLDDEAEISMDAVGVSSDESSEEEEEDYDRSFVDDGMYLTQDNALDMRAVYLRSVVSPVKGQAHHILPQVKYSYPDDSNASEWEEGEDSFVVDNNFVEYDTEYQGETMLAEDSIIHQALHDQGNSRKSKDAATGNKAKRKRIILNDTTSEEDTEGERSPVKAKPLGGVGRTPQPLHQVSGVSVRSEPSGVGRTPQPLHQVSGVSVRSELSGVGRTPQPLHHVSGVSVRSEPSGVGRTQPLHHVSGVSVRSELSGVGRTQPLYQVSGVSVRSEPSGVGRTQPLHHVSGVSVRSEPRNGGVAGNNTPGCSTDTLHGEEDLEIIMESISPKPPPGPSRPADKVLPITSRSEQGFPNSSKPQSTSSLGIQSSCVQQATNMSGSVVSGQQPTHGVRRSLGNLERTNSSSSGGGGGGVGGVTSKNTTGKGSSAMADVSIVSSPAHRSTALPGGCQSLPPVSPQLNTSSCSFFVSAEPCDSSFSISQTSVSSTPTQDAVGVLVDSSEVNSGAIVLSRLRLRYKAHTAVVHLTHAHYAISTRMAVARLSATVLSSSQHRSNLVKRVQGLLDLYERPVLIMEDEVDRGSPARQARSRYLDTILCAFAQVTTLAVLYSKDQEETSHLLWQLLVQEKTRGFKISTVPTMTKRRQQMARFYLTLPNIGYPTALVLAQSFSTVREFINSSAECIKEKGKMSLERATAVKQHLTRQFRVDMLP